ncbi:PfkB family carbohydrate kinase [Aestuariivirga litoralis]|uniref:PfkB family carbohydrate kinase n=1 Tax=Aestuariivirga litoralis TaxID=2650924 RepID=UPI0018C64721|nr:PfkB family carbohydrate kinase [Aestuariivirga litoralis]MBG1232134.1 sugar kinase [Aestuariivirga litoralis]
MKSVPNLLSVGALTYDTLFRFDELPSKPGKYLPTEALQSAAGMAASAATGAKRHGANVSLWASVGNDSVGQVLIDDMRAEGIDCSHIRRVESGRSAIATILIDGKGERMIVPYYDPQITSDPPHSNIAFNEFDVILADARWPGAAALALAGARQAGIPGIFDADVAPPVVLHRLLPLASHIVASLPACQILFGPEVDSAEATHRLAETYKVFCAVTDGSKGTLACMPGSPANHIPAYKIKAVDTLAAGDIFHGVFAACLGEKLDEIKAIEISSAAAAVKCMRFGGRLGAPTRDETFSFIRAMQK